MNYKDYAKKNGIDTTKPDPEFDAFEAKEDFRIKEVISAGKTEVVPHTHDKLEKEFNKEPYLSIEGIMFDIAAGVMDVPEGVAEMRVWVSKAQASIEKETEARTIKEILNKLKLFTKEKSDIGVTMNDLASVRAYNKVLHDIVREVAYAASRGVELKD